MGPVPRLTLGMSWRPSLPIRRLPPIASGLLQVLYCSVVSTALLSDTFAGCKEDSMQLAASCSRDGQNAYRVPKGHSSRPSRRLSRSGTPRICPQRQANYCAVTASARTPMGRSGRATPRTSRQPRTRPVLRPPACHLFGTADWGADPPARPSNEPTRALSPGPEILYRCAAVL